MTMECTNCHSKDLVKVSLAYEEGLSELQAQSRLVGVSFGTGGPGLWGGQARTSGTLQTSLSTRLRPPTKLPYWKLLVVWFLGLLVVGCVGGWLSVVFHLSDKLFQERFSVFGSIWTGILILLLCLTWRYNHHVIPKRRRRWDHSFLCRRCGTTIQVSG
jgi:preprotein translocase subunit Sss1